MKQNTKLINKVKNILTTKCLEGKACTLDTDTVTNQVSDYSDANINNLIKIFDQKAITYFVARKFNLAHLAVKQSMALGKKYLEYFNAFDNSEDYKKMAQLFVQIERSEDSLKNSLTTLLTQANSSQLPETFLCTSATMWALSTTDQNGVIGNFKVGDFNFKGIFSCDGPIVGLVGDEVEFCKKMQELIDKTCVRDVQTTAYKIRYIENHHRHCITIYETPNGKIKVEEE